MCASWGKAPLARQAPMALLHVNASHIMVSSAWPCYVYNPPCYLYLLISALLAKANTWLMLHLASDEVGCGNHVHILNFRCCLDAGNPLWLRSRCSERNL